MTAEPKPTWPGYQDSELIGGIPMHLGRMSLDELLDLEADCVERIAQARTDRERVTDYREQMYPGAIAEVVSIDLLRARRDGRITELGS